MRAIALVAGLAFAGAAIAAPVRDWSAVAAPVETGSYRIGNPAAKVKLVEYVSYTCPHCAHFTAESAAVLKGRMIRSGSVSLEVRNTIHDKLDLLAAMLARCVGPAAFPRFHDTLFARQPQWVAAGMAYDGANAERLRGRPAPAQMRALADGAGLTALARGAGMTNAAVTRCFTDPKVLERTLAVSNATNPEVRGTPAFEIDGRLVQGITWPGLEPMLRAAGA